MSGSAYASELRLYAKRLENPDAEHAADIRHAARLMRGAAYQIERHLMALATIRKRARKKPTDGTSAQISKGQAPPNSPKEKA